MTTLSGKPFRESPLTTLIILNLKLCLKVSLLLTTLNISKKSRNITSFHYSSNLVPQDFWTI